MPKTNYDVLKEERTELDGYCERELLVKLNDEYQKIVNQDHPIERQFNIKQADLYDHTEAIENNLHKSEKATIDRKTENINTEGDLPE